MCKGRIYQPHKTLIAIFENNFPVPLLIGKNGSHFISQGREVILIGEIIGEGDLPEFGLGSGMHSQNPSQEIAIAAVRA